MLRAKHVRSSDGTTWTVRRRWAPRPRWRQFFGSKTRGEKVSSPRPQRHRWHGWEWLQILDLPLQLISDLPAAFAAILLVVFLAAVVLFMILLGVPLLILLFETLLIIPVVLVAGAVSRLLFRRPWRIEATRSERPGSPPVAWNVVGWRASSRAADRMETLIHSAGRGPPDPPSDVVGSPIHPRLPR